MRRAFLILVSALCLSACQKNPTPVTTSPNPNQGTPAPTASAASTAPKGLTVKIADGKDLSFEAGSAWFDPRTDTREGTITLGNYEFVITPKNSNSVPDAKEGESRVSIGLDSPEGSEFETPIPVGDYAADAVSFVDVVYFADGAQQRYNFDGIKGQVVVKAITDSEMSGSVDLSDGSGAVLKGDFSAKVTAPPVAGEGKLPFDFPDTQLKAKEGDMVLTPAPSSVGDMMAMGEKNPGSFRPRKLVKVGEKSSIVDDGKEVEIPNSLIIALPADAKASAGDILLCYPKYGAMTCAIATDVSDPTKPKVHFFKRVFGDKSPEGDDFMGTLEPGTFLVLTEGIHSGTRVLHPNGSDEGYGQVVNVSGDSVLVSTFGGDLEVFQKSEVTAIPLKPGVKAGDKVLAPFAAGVDPGTVEKVNAKLGRVWVKFSGNPTTGLFCFGEVVPE
jgi:hypothetical protein